MVNGRKKNYTESKNADTQCIQLNTFIEIGMTLHK